MRILFLLIATLAGSAGLLSLSVCAQDLALFLGHSAAAQTLTLALFLGGMAFGAWWWADRAVASRSPLAVYAVGLVLLGILSLGFHPVFVLVLDRSLTQIYAALASPPLILLYKLVISALLILPQSILLGASLPALARGLVRLHPAGLGASVSLLYFFYCSGGAVGIGVGGFWLLERLGLGGTMTVAGWIQVGLGGLVLALRDQGAEVPLGGQARVAAMPPPPRRLLRLTAFSSGLAVVFYAVAWERLLSWVVPTTTQTMALIEVALLAGLGLGGLFAQARIGRGGAVVPTVGWGQVAMGVLALASLFTVARSFEWLQELLVIAPLTEEGYGLLGLYGPAIPLAVMVLAGMVLPLSTHALLRGNGEDGRPFGMILGLALLGGLGGGIVAVHFLMPLWGTQTVIMAGAGVNLLMGGAVLVGGGGLRAALAALGGLLLGGGALVVVERGGVLGPQQPAAPGGPLEQTVYHRDGKTATVSLRLSPGGILSLARNGQTEAAIDRRHMGGEDSYEETPVLMGALGLSHHRLPRAVAILGFGSGMATHTVLQSPRVQSVDTVEVEPAVVEGAQGFRPYNAKAYDDPRSHLQQEDPKTFLAAQGKRYDLIVALPSPPWEGAAAGLYTQEFYRLTRRHLAPGGIFVQRVRISGLDESLLSAIFLTLHQAFPHFRLYLANDRDLVVVARGDGPVGSPAAAVLAEPRVAAMLRMVGLAGGQEVAIRQFADERLVVPLMFSYGRQVYSDFFPALERQAPWVWSRRPPLRLFAALNAAPLPVLDLLEPTRRPLGPVSIEPRRTYARSLSIVRAHRIQGYFLRGGKVPLVAAFAGLSQGQVVELSRLRPWETGCPGGAAEGLFRSLSWMASQVVPYLSATDLNALWALPWWKKCQGEVGLALKRRVALYWAVGEGALTNMRLLGTDLLVRPDRFVDQGEKDYALTAALLGALAEGNKARARQIWEALGPQIYGQESYPPPIRLLLGLLYRGGGSGPAHTP